MSKRLAYLRNCVILKPGKFFLNLSVAYLAVCYIWTCCLGPSRKDTSEQNSIATKNSSSDNKLLGQTRSQNTSLHRRQRFTLELFILSVDYI